MTRKTRKLDFNCSSKNCSRCTISRAIHWTQEIVQKRPSISGIYSMRREPAPGKYSQTPSNEKRVLENFLERQHPTSKCWNDRKPQPPGGSVGKPNLQTRMIRGFCACWRA